MLQFLTKLFVISFYKSNAGFFLFFFFFFFGVVNSESLIAYHLSLITSILRSPIILIGVMAFWMLYHFKCTSYCLRIINSMEGSFMYNLQILSGRSQLLKLFYLHIMLFAPVLLYAVVVIVIGWMNGYYDSAIAITLFSVSVCCIGALTYYYRLNNWLVQKKPLAFHFLHRRTKPFFFLLLYHFGFEKKVLFLCIKALSLALLFVALVLNRSSYSNDLFIFFFQVILLVHAVFPFQAVVFLERRFSFYRNLPLRLIQYAAVYFITHAILFIPELLYLLLNGWQVMGVSTIVCYYIVSVSTLCLLTAIQYSEAMNSSEYVKVAFALFFVATFALHVQAFLFWAGVQVVIAVILFWSGFYKYERSV